MSNILIFSISSKKVKCFENPADLRDTGSLHIWFIDGEI